MTKGRWIIAGVVALVVIVGDHGEQFGFPHRTSRLEDSFRIVLRNK